MNRLRLILMAVLVCLGSASAQNYTTVTITRLQNVSGDLLTQTQGLCILPTDERNRVKSFTAGGGGVILTYPKCYDVVAGVVTSVSLATPDYTTPTGINYRFTINAPDGTTVCPLVTWSGTTFNYDNFACTQTAIATSGGTVTGNYTFSGNVTISGVAKFDNYFDLLRMTPPANPGATYLRLFAKESTGKLACLSSAGADCMPAGGGGSSAWADLTSGTNTTLAGVIGTGASISVTGSGTIAATSATALASDPADCAANQFATTIAASGALTCAALADADVPNNLTVTKAVNLTTNGFVKTSAADGTLSVDTASYLTGNQSITLSGDVTGSGTTAITTVNVNLPDGVTQAGHLLATNIAAPTSPAAGKVKLFADSTDLRFHDKNSAGTIGTTVVADAGAANQFLTAISAAGVVSKAQPAFTDISGAATDAQVPNTITLDNITQVTTRSHTSLTDIGTNTHAQVDTHVAATAAHGATGAVVGTTNTQTLTGKTVAGNDNDLSVRAHATDCTAITDGVSSETCYEQDSDRYFVCEPTAGGCDTGAEWIQLKIDGGQVQGAVATATTATTANAGDSATAFFSAGAIEVARGGTGAAPGADDQLLVSDSTSAATWRALPAGCNATTGKLHYTSATNLFSCEADATGAGGGDAITVATVAATDPDFIDTARIAFTLATVPTPDTISADIVANSVNATHIDETAAYAWSSATNTFLGASFTGPTADPADAGVVRVSNAENAVCSEAAPAGVDECISLNASEVWQVGSLNATTALTQGGTAVVLTSRALTGGAGIAVLGDLSADRTVATASGEADFLASGALTCGAATNGKMQVHTTALQYCDNAATPALQYAAYGSSTGVATSATILATTRAIYGNNFDGSAALAQIIASTYGGTGNGFAKLSGPATSEKTFTLPNATATILTDNAVVTEAQGGTGAGALTCTNQFVTSNGTAYSCSTATLAGAQYANQGTTTTVLHGNAAGNPSFAAVTTADVSATLKTETRNITLINPVVGDDGFVKLMFPTAITITRISCSVAGGTSVSIDFDERVAITPNTAGVEVIGTDIACDVDEQVTTTFTNAAIASRVPLALRISAAVGTNTVLNVNLEFTRD